MDLQTLMAPGGRVRSAPVHDFIIVRHGKTPMNNQGDMSKDFIRSWENVGLAPEGVEEARETGHELLPEHIDLIINSDLLRAKQTAEIIAGILHVPQSDSRLLRPWHMGNLTGKATDEAEPDIRRFVLQPALAVPGGEPFNTFAHRLVRGIQQAVEIAGQRRLAIVTHHRCERFLFAWQKLGFPPDLHIDLPTFLSKGESPGAIMRFEIPQTVLQRIGGFP